jgi:signal transduction histidine kinase
MIERQGQSAAVGTEDELRARVARYEAKLGEIAELVARVRHELNNPLTGVLGQSQLLLREQLNDRARKRAQTIEDLAIRMRDIVAQLREVQNWPTNSSREGLGKEE